VAYIRGFWGGRRAAYTGAAQLCDIDHDPERIGCRGPAGSGRGIIASAKATIIRLPGLPATLRETSRHSSGAEQIFPPATTQIGRAFNVPPLSALAGANSGEPAVRYCNKTSKPFKTGKRLSAKSVACFSKFCSADSKVLPSLMIRLALCGEQIPNELRLILR
jgi:hypothetical protein